jgi:hypothetical protein
MWPRHKTTRDHQLVGEFLEPVTSRARRRLAAEPLPVDLRKLGHGVSQVGDTSRTELCTLT